MSNRGYSAFAAWRAQHRLAIVASIRQIVSRPFSSLLSLSVMAIALALPLALAWSLLQMQQLSGSIQNSQVMTVYLKASVQTPEATQLAETWQKNPAVESLRLLSPEQGLQEFQQSSAIAEAVAQLGENPLPFVLIIKPKSETSNLLKQLSALPETDSVQYDSLWQTRLHAWLQLGTRLLYLLAGLFALGAILAVANNVRLDIATRELEISVMQQLGATDGYIRRPYLYGGALLGVLSGIFALALLFAAAKSIQPSMFELLSSYDSPFQFKTIAMYWLAVILAVASLFGLLGAWLAVGHHLRVTRPVEL